MDEALVVARLAHFAAAMAAFGATAFGFYAIDLDSERAQPDAVARLNDWNIAFLRVNGLVMLVSGFAIVPFVAARMAGAESAAIDLKTIALVLHDTEFGHVWCLHLLFALLLMISVAVAHARHALRLLWSGFALASLGWVGHAAGGSGLAGLGHELNQSVHLLAAGLWLGGLLPLGWLLGHSDEEQFGVVTDEALPAFSHMGYGAVAAIAITGIVNTSTLVGSVEALFGTDYGRLLSLKILFYFGMVAVALRNRFRLMPRITSGDEHASHALYRSVLIEQAIGLGILAAVSLLGTWPPPFMHHH